MDVSQYTSSGQLPADELERQRAYFQAHPPLCLEAFKTKPGNLEDIRFDGHGELINPLHAISCKCGASSHRVTIRETGIGTVCMNCTALAPVIGHASGAGQPCHCPNCDNPVFSMTLRLEYPGDLFSQPIPGMEGRESERFTWFTLAGTCSNCGVTSTLIDFETA